MGSYWSDPRAYVSSVLRYWWLVLAVAAISTVVAAAVTLTRPETYEARAQVLITRPRYQLELEPKLKTTSDTTGILAPAARMQTMTLIAASIEVEAAVRDRMGELLSPSQRTPQGLLRSVVARPRPNNPEVFEVIAEARDPQLAADIANVWAEEASKRIESIYGIASGYAAVREEADRALPLYEAAEREVLRLSVDSPAEDLSRRIQRKDSEIKLLQEQKDSVLKNNMSALSGSIMDLDQVVRDADTLRYQLSQPTRSSSVASGDALALMMLRARGYIPKELRLSTDGGTNRAERREDQLADLDVMIDALRTRRGELQTEWEDLTIGRSERSIVPGVASDDAIDEALRRAANELDVLRVQLADLTKDREATIRNRDARKLTYSVLANKAEELRVAIAAAGGEANVMQRAVPPSEGAQSRRLMINVGLAAVGGLLLGILLAFVPDLLLSMRRSQVPTAVSGPPAASPDPAPSRA
jgi:uncharacterized protein involved in exopolysaccharide biosynthesis